MPLRVAGQHLEEISLIGQPRRQMPTNEAGTTQYADFLNFHALACSSLFLRRLRATRHYGHRDGDISGDPPLQ
jgi:hypothetical protein